MGLFKEKSSQKIISNDINEIKAAVSYNDNYFVCFLNDTTAVCLINDNDIISMKLNANIIMVGLPNIKFYILWK